MNSSAPSHTLTFARGVLAETADDRIVLAIPGTNYQIHLAVYQKPTTPLSKRIVGSIRATARRVDEVKSGGRYVEPVMGRPRRIQGEVIALNQADNTITIDAGAPIVCKLADPRQHAANFRVGMFVASDLAPGASFTPALA